MSALAEIAAERDAMADQPPPAGHNNPPEPTPYEAIKAHIEDLVEEAKPWLTGAEVTTDDQAEAIKRLKDDFMLAHKAADAARIEENRPFDEGKAAVQAKYAPLISDTKSVKGKTVLALAALNEALSPYLRRKEREQQEAARIAREAAEKAARDAAEAARAAVGDLEAKEAAEELIAAAARADAEAKRAEAAKPQVRGDGRAQGLRSYWSPVLVDRKAALIHYAGTQTEALMAFLIKLAETDVREGKRQIPGFEVVEERRVA